jgi:hypothetical protein
VEVSIGLFNLPETDSSCTAGRTARHFTIWAVQPFRLIEDPQLCKSAGTDGRTLRINKLGLNQPRFFSSYASVRSVAPCGCIRRPAVRVIPFFNHECGRKSLHHDRGSTVGDAGTGYG